MGESETNPAGQDQRIGRAVRPRGEPRHGEPLRRSVVRAAALLLGTLAIATAFVATHVGALHDPRPRDVPVGVVRDDQPARSLLAGVREQGRQLRPVGYAHRDAAEAALHRREIYALLTTGPDAPGLTLTTATAASPAAATTVTEIVTAAAARAQIPLAVTDAVPVATADPRGLTPFYLAVGLVLGGYLGAAAIGISLGTVPHTPYRAVLRIGGLAWYAALLGLAGALVTGPALGVWSRHLPSLVGAGALVAFAAAMAASAVQGWLGLVGTGLVILLLVVLGNPGSGGIYPPEFLPAFFRDMHRWNIPGLATDLIRSVLYFPPGAARWPAATLGIWAGAGMLVLLAATAVLGRPRTR